MSQNNKDAEKDALRKLDEELNESSAENLEKQVESLGDKEVEEAEVIGDKPKSLGKVERFDYAKEEIEETERKFGWHRLWPEQFPSGGRYYSDDMKVLIKAATVNEIRHFSIIDEEDPYSVDEAITDLLKICAKVSFEGKAGSWKDIKEEDKIYIILAIRELTFAENENRIAFSVKCKSCGSENEMEIKNENFHSRGMPEKLGKYYDEEKKKFIIKTRKYGEFPMVPPSIGVMRVVADYIKGLHQAGENMKEHMPFLKILPYMVDEWRGFSIGKINNLKVEFMRWDKNKFLLFTQLTENMQVGFKEKMTKFCESCGEAIEAEVQFPSGIKGLFIEDDILDNELI